MRLPDFRSTYEKLNASKLGSMKDDNPGQRLNSNPETPKLHNLY